MFDCKNLIHPFQSEPGTSQRQRVMEELLSGAAKIDARSLADLLDYFVKLAPHINFYDNQMYVQDWQPFFKHSIPFTLASVINYPVKEISRNYTLYNTLFDKRALPNGIQLNAHFLFYHFIDRINKWHLVLKKSELPLETYLDSLIREKLRAPVLRFISYVNAAVQLYHVKHIDFNPLYENKTWNLGLDDLFAIYSPASSAMPVAYKQIHDLNDQFKSLFPVFSDAIKEVATEAIASLNLSLVHTKEELQKKHEPHLALLFAFLNLFRHLQDDLNQFTRRHLDFFYKDILQLKPAAAVPDRAHVLFEIQKQLKKYILNKGLSLKGGKDIKKQEILFDLDDEIAVNKTEIVDKRTMFVNNRVYLEQAYVEGLYIAPDATKADGVAIDFPAEAANFSTIGNRLSKFKDPETKLFKPFPNGRLGFVLGAPVLFMQDGSTRTVEIKLKCRLNEAICDELIKVVNAKKDCCSDGAISVPGKNTETPLNFYSPSIFLTTIKSLLNETFYYLNQDILKEAKKKGIDEDLAQKLREKFLLEIDEKYDKKKKQDYCNCPVKKDKYEGILNEDDYYAVFGDEIEILLPFIQPRKLLNVYFSGEKEWIRPVVGKRPGQLFADKNLSFDINGVANKFVLTITAVLTPDMPAVTFYDPLKLKEELGTVQPAVKIELDDKIKFMDFSLSTMVAYPPPSKACCVQTKECCVLKEKSKDIHQISAYHFFRTVMLNEIDPEASVINVDVCGLKHAIVQNDDSVMDINGPIFPFGARPKVGSNFYIGAEEIFMKRWTDIYINLNWKDLPADFKSYYVAYQTRLTGMPPSNVVENHQFKIDLAILQDGNWIPWKHTFVKDNLPNKKYNLFQPFAPTGLYCVNPPVFSHQFAISHLNDFNPALPYPNEKVEFRDIKKLEVLTRQSFLRITLQYQDFQHSIYPFILGRQMTALGKLPEQPVNGAVYYEPGTTNAIVFDTNQIKTSIDSALNLATEVKEEINNPAGDGINQNVAGAGNIARIREILRLFPPPAENLILESVQLEALINSIKTKISNIEKLAAVIPPEPYTPTFSLFELGYKAIATMKDIELVHLYPFAGTYKKEEFELQPPLFPTFCDEGTLFLGLSELVPGNNLNILFQLAEATSDSESEKAEVNWHYLDSNIWKSLRSGFEVLDDATDDLTTSGIVKFALPSNMTKDNTVMPKDLHWIKASVRKNSRSVSETMGIHPQAMLAVFNPGSDNDLLRLFETLSGGTISKLNEADASIKLVSQPYETFGGRLPESEGPFYVRVSELLRHKGRAIQPWDYERIVLEEFPQLYKAKCISHSFALDATKYKNDFPYAPGYVILAVIPDLYKLKAGFSFEPKAPVSILEEVEDFIRKCTSPFVRFRARNPIYEKVDFCIRVRLLKGKDENYYKEKLKEDLRVFMAPWAIGEFHRLSFGECIYRSEIIRFLETSGYVDFITDLRMGKNKLPNANANRICPDTPRSILIAGDIEVCIEPAICIDWNKNYKDCDGNIIDDCDTKPVPVVDYCK